jgi:hypothetical protein
LSSTDNEPTEYLGSVDGNGKFGLYAELGGFKIMNHGFFDFFDYGLAYRQEAGEEELITNLVSGSDPALPQDVTGLGEYSQDHARAFFNLNKGIPLMRHTFLLQSVGVDFEYRVINKADYIHNFSILDSLGQNPFNDLGPEESFSAHLHYKAGIGYKTSPGGWLILSVETPIQTLVPFDGVQSRQIVFNTQYRPVIFSLRYMWLRKRPDRTCAPVKSRKKKIKEKAKRKGGKGVRDGQIH